MIDLASAFDQKLQASGSINDRIARKEGHAACAFQCVQLFSAGLNFLAGASYNVPYILWLCSKQACTDGIDHDSALA